MTVAAIAVSLMAGCAGVVPPPTSLNNAVGATGAVEQRRVPAVNNTADAERSIASRVLTSVAIERVLGPGARPRGLVN